MLIQVYTCAQIAGRNYNNTNEKVNGYTHPSHTTREAQAKKDAEKTRFENVENEKWAALIFVISL